jgi:hypothetical protein
MRFLQKSGRLVVISMMACGHAPPTPAPAAPATRTQLAVLPAESDVFPVVARAVSAELAAAKVGGMDEMRVSKVSLEVAQLSIECVEPTTACYQAVGRSMSANRLLFARVDPGAGARQLKLTVTLFDVDGSATRRTQAQVFATEQAALAGMAALVAAVTQ